MTALTLTLDTYRDKVLGAWKGKSAGVTLGAGQRGQLTPGRSNYYSPVPGQPTASAAIDFPLVWLHTLEKTGPDVLPEDLAVAWLEHLDYSQDEYGYSALNLRRGLPPPASGAHSNWFRHATGGVLRADFWSLIAPGAPQTAAAYAYHDTKLDHSEDGVWASMFLAAIGSAAFFLSDPIILLTIGLAMIPRTCRTARAVKVAIAAYQRSASWLEARESVQHEVGTKNFTDAPQNLGFFAIGLLYGGRNFGTSLCAGVNCGYDSEVIGGALGAVMGILKGSAALPEDWTRPIGDIVIPGMGVRDFDAPTTLTAVADRTVAVGKQVVAERCPDVSLVDVLPEAAPSRFYAEDFLTTPPVAAPTALDADFTLPSTTSAPPVGETAVTPETAVQTDAPISQTASSEPALEDAASANPEGVTPLPGSPLDRTNSQTGSLEGKLQELEIAPDEVAPYKQSATESPSALEIGDHPNVAALADTDELATVSQTFPTASSDTTPVPDAAPVQPAAFATTNTPAPSPPPTMLPGAFAPQRVSEAPPPPADASAGGEPAAPIAAVAADPVDAIAWADSSRIKPLLVTPPNAMVGQAGTFAVIMDTGDSPTLAYNVPKTLSFAVFNQNPEAFSGRITLLAPPGWQITAPPNIGQRQYIAAGSGTLRADFTVRAPEGAARIDIANAITLRLTPDNGSVPVEVEFVLLGAACWWTTGPFANFDGEGFDRSYTPEDRPGLTESYLSRSMQNIKWEKRTFTDSALDLEPLFKNSSGVCYGQTILRSPTAREARIVANNNSGVKVWLNGALALRRFNRESFRPILGSGAWAADVNLRAGDNVVLVKWVRGSEPYQFSLTVSDRHGRGLPEIGNTGW